MPTLRAARAVFNSALAEAGSAIAALSAYSEGTGGSAAKAYGSSLACRKRSFDWSIHRTSSSSEGFSPGKIGRWPLVESEDTAESDLSVSVVCIWWRPAFAGFDLMTAHDRKSARECRFPGGGTMMACEAGVLTVALEKAFIRISLYRYTKSRGRGAVPKGTCRAPRTYTRVSYTLLKNETSPPGSLSPSTYLYAADIY